LINLQIDLKVFALEERRKTTLLAFIKDCPAHNILKGNPGIEFKLMETP